MTRTQRFWLLLGALMAVGLGLNLMATSAEQPEKKPTSYLPVIEDNFDDVLARMKADKPKVMKRQMDLLEERYDLSDRPAKGVTMSKGKKAVQEGVRVKLPSGVTWEALAKMSP